MPRAAWMSLALFTSACATPSELEEFARDLDHDMDGVSDVIDCSPRDPDVQGLLWFPDRDGDGHGDPGEPTESCTRPAEGAWVLEGDDCNDLDAAVYAVAVGYPDADGDGVGHGLALRFRCDGGRTLAPVTGDCDDDDPEVSPEQPAVCGNAKDDDCDGSPDCDTPDEDQAASDADAAWVGAGEQALGASVAEAGDIDGDGFDDVVVGAPDERGVAYVLRGPFLGAGEVDAVATTQLTGLEAAEAGTALSGAGDVDGDGYDDFVVGAPGTGGGGAVLVYGPIRGAEDGDDELSTASLDMVALTLDDDGAGAGASLAAPGDLRGGDEVADLAVGAPGGSAVYVVRGPLDRDVDLADDDAVQVIDGAGELALGSAMVSVGDLDGDGRPELAVGAPGYTGSFRAPLGVSADALGAVYVFFETGNFGVEDADVALLGEDEGTQLGATLADGGDADGDGLEDLLVGAPGADADAGGAWLFAGAALRDEPAPELDAAAARFYGSGRGENAGQGLLGGADLNFDGEQDLLIGSPRSGEDSVGLVGVWYGPVNGSHGTENADLRFTGDLDDDGGKASLFGWCMAFSTAGDLLVGAPGWMDPTSAEGDDFWGPATGEDDSFHDGAAYTFHLGW